MLLSYKTMIWINFACALTNLALFMAFGEIVSGVFALFSLALAGFCIIKA